METWSTFKYSLVLLLLKFTPSWIFSHQISFIRELWTDLGSALHFCKWSWHWEVGCVTWGIWSAFSPKKKELLELNNNNKQQGNNNRSERTNVLFIQWINHKHLQNENECETKQKLKNLVWSDFLPRLNMLVTNSSHSMTAWWCSSVCTDILFYLIISRSTFFLWSLRRCFDLHGWC